MEKISKNVEMTGERHREYDQWRSELNLGHVTVPFLEYRRIPLKSASNWPIFQLLASVYPAQTDSDAQPTEDDLENSFKRHWEDLIKFNLLAKRIDAFPSYVGLMNKDRNWFLVQQFPRKDQHANDQRQPKLFGAAEFVQTILQQTWMPDHPERTGNPKNDPFKSYSSWHRKAVPPGALVTDIDYVEIRSDEPVAVIEATRSNSNDLNYGLFSFLSRGFAQASVIVMVAEDLEVGAHLVAYLRNMSEVGLLKIDRSLISMIDELDRARQQKAKQWIDAGYDRKTAQGKATQSLYTTQDSATLMQSLKPRTKRMPIAKYSEWLLSLEPDAGE